MLHYIYSNRMLIWTQGQWDISYSKVMKCATFLGLHCPWSYMIGWWHLSLVLHSLTCTIWSLSHHAWKFLYNECKTKLKCHHPIMHDQGQWRPRKVAHFITFEYEMSHFPCVQINVRLEHMQCNTKKSWSCHFYLPILFIHFSYQIIL